MLINVRSDREFQSYLDREEQRLHNRLFPIFRAGIRMQASQGAVHGHNYIVKRGEQALRVHYKRVYRDVYTQTVHSQKQARTGVTDFLAAQVSWLERRAARLIGTVAQSIGDYIRNFIMDGVNRGLSNQEITRQIYDSADDISRSRAATIARTETHSSATAAMHETVDYLGIDVKTKTWWSVNDQRVRPSHVDMHGVTVPYSEPFDTDDGQCMFPGDNSLGMDIGGLINCRCVVLYNTAEEEAPQGFEPEPALQLEARSEISADFRSELNEAISKMPDPVRKTLARAGVSIKTGHKIIDVQPDLAGIQPRGWPEGTTWDNADGVFFRAKNEVSVAEYYKPFWSQLYARTDRGAGTLLHESGHAFDAALGGASKQPSFVRMYSNDVANLSLDDIKLVPYYTQSGNAGPEEAFAEIFAQNLVGGPGGAGRDIRRYFPNVTKYVAEAIKSGALPAKESGV